MADLKKLKTLIPKGESVPEFGKRILKHLPFETSKDRELARKALNQLSTGLSVKFKTLDVIADETGKDYNEILNYDGRERTS
jgi:hypothetical protein